MDAPLTLHARETVSAPLIQAIKLDAVMINQFAPGISLPCPVDRQKIMEQAKLVLAEARVVGEQSDRTLALLSAGQSGTRAAAALVFHLTP